MRITFAPVNVEEMTSLNFDIFPNPSSDGNINLNIPQVSGLSLVQITNQLGEVVYNSQLASGKHTLQLSLTKGVYNIQVIGSTGLSGVKKVIMGS